jgi:aryl-alcohol dehydrogenase-like predicted oxidoreductase
MLESSINPKLPQRHPILDNIEIGTGTWSWGDQLYWGFGRGYNVPDIQAVFESNLKAGQIFFDTAEMYGQGRSETFLGNFIESSAQHPIIATKFMPYPWRLHKGTLIKALRASLKRLKLSKVDLYQMHWPLPPLTIETWMVAMTEAYQAGLLGAVGVSNYNRDQTQRAYEALRQENIPLASNQVEYNLLNRKIETNGVFELCKELGITIIAYSPLAMGILTGKYTPETPPQGIRGNRYNRKFLAQIQPLLTLLSRIGADHGGKTSAQVALNWIISKGAIPIPGAKNLKQAEQNAGSTGWRLTDEEISRLDEASNPINNKEEQQ